MGLSSNQVSINHCKLEWVQTMLGSDGLDSLPKPRSSRRQPWTPQSEPLKCPRCDSTNTKFCYYNNYDKTQPRHFCKACKRHWTKGGTLRNVPIGGGRKNKRFKRPNTVTATTAAATVAPMAIRKDHCDVDHKFLPPGLSDPEGKFDADKASLFKPVDSEMRDDVGSYTDTEELMGLVSWDFDISFSGCTMQQLPHQDHQSVLGFPRLGFSKLLSSFETNPGSNTPRSFNEKLENDEESIISTTTSMIMPSYQQWQAPSTSSFLEPNYWNWNDFDTMVSADIKKPWEDPQFKT